MINTHLKGKNILVTGASKGIGYAIAEFLLENEAHTALHYNSDIAGVQRLVEKYGEGRTRIFQANFSKPETAIDLFTEVRSYFQNLDAIVINAGAFIPHEIDLPIEDWYDIWKKTMDINLNTAALLTKSGLDHFMAGEGGRFIYIGSRAALRGETKEYLAYAASKGGLSSLAKSVARSFGKDNIKSFVVAPGFTRTEMAESFISKYGEQKVLDEIALPELTRPQDIAPLVGMLCSGLLDHATGATFDLNAGSHIR